MSGTLTARILQNVKHILNYSSYYIPTIVFMSSALIMGIGVCFFFEWRTTLICIAFFPLIVISMYYQSYFMEAYSNEFN